MIHLLIPLIFRHRAVDVKDLDTRFCLSFLLIWTVLVSTSSNTLRIVLTFHLNQLENRIAFCWLWCCFRGKSLLPITSGKDGAQVPLVTVILCLPSRKLQNDTFPSIIYLSNNFPEISCRVWIQRQRSVTASRKTNGTRMDSVRTMVSFLKSSRGTVLFTCTAVLLLQLLFLSQIISPSTTYWSYHFLLSQKYAVSHLAPGVLVLPSTHMAYLPFSVGKFSSCFYLLSTFFCFLSFLFLHTLLPLFHRCSLLSSSLFHTLSHLNLLFFTFLFSLSLWNSSL